MAWIIAGYTEVYEFDMGTSPQSPGWPSKTIKLET